MGTDVLRAATTTAIGAVFLVLGLMVAADGAALMGGAAAVLGAGVLAVVALDAVRHRS